MARMARPTLAAVTPGKPVSKKPAPKKAPAPENPNHESYRYDWRQRNNLKRGSY